MRIAAMKKKYTSTIFIHYPVTASMTFFRKVRRNVYRFKVLDCGGVTYETDEGIVVLSAGTFDRVVAVPYEDIGVRKGNLKAAAAYLAKPDTLMVSRSRVNLQEAAFKLKERGFTPEQIYKLVEVEVLKRNRYIPVDDIRRNLQSVVGIIRE
jgi:hypothetical protein